MILLEPDRPLGHSDAQIRAVLSAKEYAEFVEYVFHKTSAREEDGLVYYEKHVRRFLATLERRSR